MLLQLVHVTNSVQLYQVPHILNILVLAIQMYVLQYQDVLVTQCYHVPATLNVLATSNVQQLAGQLIPNILVLVTLTYVIV